MLLRRCQNRSHWRAASHGLLPLSLMPFLVGRTRQCLLPLETGGREGHGWCRARGDVRQDAYERTPVLQEMRWASDGQSSATEDGRCIRGDDPVTEVCAGRSRQLRGDGTAYEGWPHKVQRLPLGIRRIR